MKESTSIEERNATFNGSPKKTLMKESIAALSASFLDGLRRHEQNLSTARGATSDELVIDRSQSIFGVRGDKRIVFVLPPGFKRKGFGYSIEKDGIDGGGSVAWANDDEYDATIHLHGWVGFFSKIKIKVFHVTGVYEEEPID
ncbi:MAG: hypothetical protein WAW42_11045 [Candidatus Competibacteraceae bacterium]